MSGEQPGGSFSKDSASDPSTCLQFYLLVLPNRRYALLAWVAAFLNQRIIANSLIEKPESERKELASRTDRVRGTERGFITASDLLFPAHDIDPQAPSDI